MRIAVVATSRVPSRTANSIRVMKVCQALTELGHEVRLWVPGPKPDDSWPDLAHHYGLRLRFSIEWVAAWPPLRRWDFVIRAMGRSNRWSPDVWYVWPYQAAAALSILARATVLEVHDRPTGLAGPLLFRLFLKGRGARRLLVITDALRSSLERMYGVDLKAPFVVLTPSGVDLEPYQSLPEPRSARARLGWQERFTAGYLGHLYPGRGLDLLADVAGRNPDVAFVWAGGEPESVGAWRTRLDAQGLSNVSLLGFLPQEELPLVAAACEVLLMPYERSIAVSSGGDTAAFASPMKAFEYMAAGRAILASDLPVLHEILDPEVAILLEPESIEAWDRALQRVRSDPDLVRRLGQAARVRAARYSWLERTRRALDGIQASPQRGEG